MQKHFFKFKKVVTNISCYPLILISNNLELAAKFLPNDVDQSISTLEIPNITNGLFAEIDIKNKGEQAIFVKTLLNLKKCFCIVFKLWCVKDFYLIELNEIGYSIVNFTISFN